MRKASQAIRSLKTIYDEKRNEGKNKQTQFKSLNEQKREKEKLTIKLWRV